ncbi:MAG: polysaccharide biosynthesis/export family protein, partial [Candidatus Binatia bacterium]
MSSSSESSESIERLRRLAAQRKKRTSPESYRIGPGVLIEVSVLGEKELNRKLRISQSGRVSIPLVGTINAAGRTEEQLARDIAATLSREHLQ